MNGINDVRTLWKDQTMPATQFAPLELQRQSNCLMRTVRRRNRIEYAAAALVALLFGASAFGLLGMPSGEIQRITHVAGSMLMIAGAAVVSWQLHLRASVQPANPGASDTLSYHLAALERQRDALRSVWLWYIGPLVPGFAVLFAGAWLNPDADKMLLALIQAIVVLVLLGVIALNWIAAARMQREIDGLREESSQSAAHR